MPGELTNNLLRKLPTASVVAGPPIFMKTMAVGPLLEVASCVIGGTTVASDRAGTICHRQAGERTFGEEKREGFLEAIQMDLRKFMSMCCIVLAQQSCSFFDVIHFFLLHVT